MIVMGIDALSALGITLSMRWSTLMTWCICCCMFSCRRIAAPHWYIPSCSGFVRPGIADDVIILYPFRVKSRSCGMCVSCIADMRTLCLCSSYVRSFCRCVLIMLSGLMLTIVSFPPPTLFAMVSRRAFFALYRHSRDCVFYVLFLTRFLMARRHGSFFDGFVFGVSVRCSSFASLSCLSGFLDTFPHVFSLAVVLVIMWFRLPRLFSCCCTGYTIGAQKRLTD